MGSNAKDKPVLVIPCSGIGKVHGLISREATCLVTDEWAPGQTDTLLRFESKINFCSNRIRSRMLRVFWHE